MWDECVPDAQIRLRSWCDVGDAVTLVPTTPRFEVSPTSVRAAVRKWRLDVRVAVGRHGNDVGCEGAPAKALRGPTIAGNVGTGGFTVALATAWPVAPVPGRRDTCNFNAPCKADARERFHKDFSGRKNRCQPSPSCGYAGRRRGVTFTVATGS